MLRRIWYEGCYERLPALIDGYPFSERSYITRAVQGPNLMDQILTQSVRDCETYLRGISYLMALSKDNVEQYSNAANQQIQYIRE